ncbi:MAG: SDR family oxidoreductase [Pyrinomonadaceae bacterium]
MKSKTAIVTGGTAGIGFAIAERLVKMGTRVYICGRDEARVSSAVEELASSGEVGGIVCDVRDEEQVKSLVDACETRFGGLDVLVNNAGLAFPGKTVEQISGEEFRQTLETNLFGVFYACHYAIPLMKRSGGGYIINISSLAGQNAHPKMAAYNASKFGLNGFTEALMQEVRNDNIKVSYICPGSVNTRFGNDTPSNEKAWQLQPADIAQVVADLLVMDPRALPSKVEIRPSSPPARCS